MSSCERCWADSYIPGGPVGKRNERYSRLIRKRDCTPEQQAGPDAAECPACGRESIHQVTGEPMCGCELEGPLDYEMVFDHD